MIKKNGPGCNRCEYVHIAQIHDVIAPCFRTNQPVLFTANSLFGADSTWVGMDVERRRLIGRKGSDGTIWSVPLYTRVPEALFLAGSDIVGDDPVFIKYYHSLQVAYAVCYDGFGAQTRYGSIDENGDWIQGPFDTTDVHPDPEMVGGLYNVTRGDILNSAGDVIITTLSGTYTGAPAPPGEFDRVTIRDYIYKNHTIQHGYIEGEVDVNELGEIVAPSGPLYRYNSYLMFNIFFAGDENNCYVHIYKTGLSNIPVDGNYHIFLKISTGNLAENDKLDLAELQPLDAVGDSDEQFNYNTDIVCYDPITETTEIKFFRQDFIDNNHSYITRFELDSLDESRIVLHYAPVFGFLFGNFTLWAVAYNEV
jgi:hypothetical protein